jgi:hypothetical protein
LSLDIFDFDSPPFSQALSGLFDPAQETLIGFELIVEPVVLGPEPDQHTGRLPVAGDDDPFTLGFAQKPGEIILDLG